MDRTLGFYDIKNDDELIFKKKHRPLKVLIVDGAQRTVIIDESGVVGDVVTSIGRKMGMKNPEEYSLLHPDTKKWLNPQKSLPEQAVPASQPVILRKKWFVSDSDVSDEDPVQLHMIYSQGQQDVVEGRHIVREEECCQFAALQCQVTYGNFNAAIHIPGFLKSKAADFFPAFMHKKAGDHEKVVFREYRKLTGMTELKAKYRYVQLLRSLRSYGVTMFECKKRPKVASSKPLPYKLGVSQNAILELDTKTGAVIKERPLAHLRRWVAAPTTFTLDFGDFADELISLLTDEGDQISQLIAGYIDILLKKRNEAGQMVEEDDSQTAAVESIGRVKGQAIRGQTSFTTGSVGAQRGQVAQMSGAKRGVVMSGAGFNPQQMKVESLGEGSQAVRNLVQQSQETGVPSQSTMTVMQWQQQLLQHVDNVGAQCGKLLSDMESGAPDNLPEVGVLSAMASELAGNVGKLLAAAHSTSGAMGGDRSVLDAARNLAQAVGDMMEAADNLAKDPKSPQAMQAFREAAMQLDHARGALHAVARGNAVSDADAALLLEAAKAVALATQGMHQAAGKSGNAALIKQANDSVLAGRGLLSATKMLGPVVLDPDARNKLDKAAATVDTSTQQLAQAVKGQQVPANVADAILAQAKAVSDAIAQLRNAANAAEKRPAAQTEQFTKAADRLIQAAEAVKGATGTPKALVHAIKEVAQASGGTVVAAKHMAKAAPDAASKARLMDSARALADSTRRLVDDAKAAAQRPTDQMAQQRVVGSANELQGAVRTLVGDTGRTQTLAALRAAAKEVTAANASLHSLAHAGKVDTGDPATDAGIRKATAEAMVATNALMAATVPASRHPEQAAAQAALAEVARKTVPEVVKTVQAAKLSGPKVRDAAGKKALLDAAKASADAVKKLLAASREAAAASGSAAIDAVLEELSTEDALLDSAVFDAQGGTMFKPPGKTKAMALGQLNKASDKLGHTAKALPSVAAKPATLGQVAQDAGTAATTIAQASRDIAAFCDPRVATEVLKAAKNLNTGAMKALEAAKAAVMAPAKDATAAKAQSAAIGAETRALSEAMQTLVELATESEPGAKECDAALAAVAKGRDALVAPAGVTPNADFKTASQALRSAAQGLSGASAQLKEAAITDKTRLGARAEALGKAYGNIVDKANAAAAAGPERATQSHIVQRAAAVADALGAQIRSAKLASADDVNSQAGLLDASRAVAAAIADLLKLADTTSPGAREFASANEAVRSTMDALNRPAQPPTQPRELATMEQAMKSLDAAAGTLATASQAPGPEAHKKMVPAAQAVSQALAAIADATKTHAGHGGGGSAVGPGGALSPRSAMTASSSLDMADPAQRAQNAVDSLISAIQAKPLNRPALVAAAKAAAVAGGELVAGAKTAAGSVSDAQKRALLNAAQALANSIQKLVGSAKDVARAPDSDAAKQSATAAAQGFAIGVTNLMTALPESVGGTLRTVRASASAAAATKSKASGELLAAARSLAFNVSQLLSAAEPALEAGGATGFSPDEVTTAAADVREATRGMAIAVKDARPGFAELAGAIQRVEAGVSELDAAVIDADVGILEAAEGKTLADCHTALGNVAVPLANAISALGKSDLDATALKAASTTVGKGMGSLVDAARDAASLHTEPSTQLDPAIVTANAILDVLQAARAGKPANERAALANAANTAVSSMVSSMKGGGGAGAAIDTAIEAVGTAMASVSAGGSGSPATAYADATRALSGAARAVQSVCSAMYMSGSSDPKSLPRLAAPVGTSAPAFASAVMGVAAHVGDAAKRAELTAAGAGVLKATQGELQASKSFFADPTVAASRSAFTVAAGSLPKALKKLQEVLDSTDAGSQGVRQATMGVGKQIGRLDETALFAAAGQFDYDAAAKIPNAPVEFADAQQRLATSVSAVASAGQSFVGSLTKGPGAVATGAQGAGASVTALASTAIATAALMGDATGQSQLLNAAKDLGIAMQTLMQAGKLAYTSPGAPRMEQNVAGALKQLNLTAESVASVASSAQADSSETGAELDKARAALQKAVVEFDSAWVTPMRNAQPRPMVGAALTLAQTSSALVGACNASSEDLLTAIAASLKAGISLLGAAKGGQETAPNDAAKAAVVATAKSVCTQMGALYAAVKTQSRRPSAAGADALGKAQDALMDAVGTYVEAVKAWPNSEDAVRMYFSGENLEQLAATALANSRDLVAQALAAVVGTMPPGYVPSAPDKALDKEDIKEAFVDASAGVFSAVKYALQKGEDAVKEIVTAAMSGSGTKGGKSAFLRDPTWARTLMTEADDLGKATTLVANQVVRAIGGSLVLEELDASSKKIATETSKLVAVTRVKTPTGSPLVEALNNAGRSVAKMTALLIAVGKEFEDQLANPNAFDDTIDESEEAIRKQVEILELRKKIAKLQQRVAH